MKKPIVLLVTVTALVAGAAGAGSAKGPVANGARLHAFGSCGELLAYVKREAMPLVGPYGLGGGLVKAMPVGAPSTARGADSGAEDFSTTNVQEQGVDEPDIVMSNGSHLFAVRGDRLYALDARAPRPRFVDSLPLERGGSHELLLAGTTLLVISRGGVSVRPLPGAVRSVAPTLRSQTVLTEVDVSAPARLRLVRTLTIDADYVSARLVDGTVRLVTVASIPQKLHFVQPTGTDQQATSDAARRNRALVASSRVASWLPTYLVNNRRSGARRERSLVQCRQVQRPASFSGLGLLTVLTLDLDKGLDPVDSDSVLSDGRIVYASPRRLYVATERWSDRPLPARPTVFPVGVRTALHAFDISDSTRTVYRASGVVPGFLLDQWSLSEYRGVLRVASTEAPPWLDPASTIESESFVTTLDEQAGRLVPLGRIGGLGRGERIYGVRFAGDVGYVVTFRQVDPLYTLDLSTPARPEVVGELKLQGYSAYLHPLGGDLLLGLGQDATAEGRALGTQLSLFDVSNLRRPARLQRWTIGSSTSEAEYDHHAFLYWAPSRLVVVPVSAYGAGASFAGAIGLQVGRGGIHELGRIAHPGPAVNESGGGSPIRRSLVVGNRLLTVSDAGVQASTLSTLASLGWAGFGAS